MTDTGGGMRTLVVASPTVSPLCTAVPVPTEGQGDWLRCTDSECGHRQGFGDDWCDNYHDSSPDGPYPFTVSVWREVSWCPHDSASGDGPWPPNVWTCDQCGARWRDVADPFGECWSSARGNFRKVYEDEPVGAVTHLVEVTGPSRRWFESHAEPTAYEDWRSVNPNALPDCWHTPTGKVTALDVPVPMERPPRYAISDDGMGDHFEQVSVAETWWAELAMEVEA